MNMTDVLQYAAYILVAIGVMAFLVSVITQVIKELPCFKQVPTAVVVIVLSLVLCPAALVALLAWLSKPIAAFIVALVAMDGWERVAEIWQRTKYNNKH